MHTWHLAWCCFCEASSALWEYRWTWSHWTVDHGSSHQETPTNDNYFPLFFKSHYHITFHSDSPFLPSSASARLSRVTTVLTELSKSRARTFSLIADPLDPLTNVLKSKRVCLWWKSKCEGADTYWSVLRWRWVDVTKVLGASLGASWPNSLGASCPKANASRRTASILQKITGFTKCMCAIEHLFVWRELQG